MHERLERLLEEIKVSSNRIEDDGQKEIRDRRRRKDFIKVFIDESLSPYSFLIIESRSFSLRIC